MKNFSILLSLTAALVLSACQSPSTKPSPTAAIGQEARLIAVLKSGASQKENADACRELAHVGTEASVPALVALLGDEKLSHMARYGLETMPSPAVDKALRDALGTLKGRQLAGVITSLGVRRDSAAVKPVGLFLQDADPDVVNAAARALGDIGTKSAAQALEAALPTAPSSSRLAVCEGLFRCAEKFAAQGQRNEATRIYDRLRGLPNAAHEVRAGALRGAILTHGEDGLALLQQSLRHEDYVLFAAAVRAASELPGGKVTKVLADELPTLPADRQVVVLQALGERGDRTALPAVLAVMKSDNPAARTEALRVAARVGDSAAVSPLLEVAVAPDADSAKTALEALAILRGEEVDSTLIGSLRAGEANIRKAAMDAVSRRGSAKAVPDLLKAASDASPDIREAAFKALGETARSSDLSALVGLLVKDGSSSAAAEAAVERSCARLADKEACAAPLLAALPQAGPAAKAALVRLLGQLGGSRSLVAVRAALEDTDSRVRNSAVQALADWPDAGAAPDLLRLVRSGANPEQRDVAFRGYLRLAREAELPADQKLKMFQEAASLARDTAEKKLVLAALGDVTTVASLKLAATYLSDAELADEAGAAAVKICEALDAAHKAEMEPILNQVLNSAKAQPVLDQARKRLRQLSQR